MYQLEIDGEKNYNPFDTTFLHNFGKSLSSNSQLASIFHINGNHWIVVVINIPADEILYGDPVGSDPNLEVFNSLRWFISKHIPSLPKDELVVAILLCAKQDVNFDRFNCGIHSYNVILYYFLPNNLLLKIPFMEILLECLSFKSLLGSITL